MHIHVKIVYGDYQIHHEEQEYHDKRIGSFKWKLENYFEDYNYWIKSDLFFNYYPETRKFALAKNDPVILRSFNNALRLQDEFKREYF